MLKYYAFVWLSIAIGGSIVNTFLWWMEEMVFSTPDPRFNLGFDYFIFVFIAGFIGSALFSFPSLFIIYLIEQWKKIPFTIWLHFSIFVVHFVGTFFFIGLELFGIIGLIGYEIIGVVAYYFLVYKKVMEIKSNTELIDSESEFI
jgi:hypothetical protein